MALPGSGAAEREGRRGRVVLEGTGLEAGLQECHLESAISEFSPEAALPSSGSVGWFLALAYADLHVKPYANDM
jgi:hypothetical protein